MIDRTTFEAHVRAGAPYRTTKADMDDWYVIQGPTMVFGSHGWLTLADANILRDRLNTTYIAARMEHEWPVVNALQKHLAWTCHMLRTQKQWTSDDCKDVFFEQYAALSPYTTKPIER